MKNNLKIVSYNLRMWNDKDDGINSFMHRIGMIFQKIQNEQPDIIGFQEVLPEMHIYLERLLTEYHFAGQFRDADFLGEGTYIAVKKDVLQILEYNTFWLSPTPYVPGSRFQDQSICPRICNVVRLRHKKSNFIFRVFNLHLDHEGESARVKGMESVLRQMEELNEIQYLPAVILGDFNAGPESDVIAMCNRYESAALTDITTCFEGTYHGFGNFLHEKIDYIFVTKELASKVKEVYLWDDCHSGIYLSDHYPICSVFEIGK